MTILSMAEHAAPARHASTYGWRAKLGVIVPPTNTVNEAEWQRMMPDGVTFHTARMVLHDTSTAEGEAALLTDLGTAVGDLVPARVDVIAYACTAGSMTVPATTLPNRIATVAERPAVTTAAAIVAALEAVGAKRVAVATPYDDRLNAHEVEFLTACGFTVTAIAGLGYGAGGRHEYIRIAETPLDRIAAHAESVMAAGPADALLLSCTDLPTLPLIDGLEEAFGVPTISSNTATLWRSLRLAGIDDPVPGGGRLFAAA